MPTKIITAGCILCQKLISFEIPVKERDHYPFSYIYYHGQPLHALITYIDANYRVRGNESVNEVGGLLNNSPHFYRKKCVVTGDWGVGKSSLVSTLVKGDYDRHYDPTLMLNISKCTFTLPEKLTIEIMFWEMGGQRSARNEMVRRKIIGNADGAIIMCDITRQESLEVIEPILNDIHSYAEKGCQVLGLANKTDLAAQRAIPRETIDEFKKKYKVPFYEVTMKEKYNFEDIIPPWIEKMVTS